MRISPNFNTTATAQKQSEKTGTFRMDRSAELRARQNRARGRRDFVAERLAAEERERRIREAEDERILQINERMNILGDRRGALREEIDHITERMSTLEREAEQQRIQRLFGGAEEIDEIDDTVMPNAVEANEQFDYLAHGEDRLEKLSHELSMVESTMDSLSAQLAQIHTNRAEREMVALDREFARAKMEMEERMRERERIAEEQQNRCEEELDAAAERSTTRALVNMSVKAENIRSLSSTRSQLQAAATRLRGEADFDARFNRRSNDAIESNGVQQNVQAIENYKNAKAAADEDPTLPTPTRPTPVQDAAFFAGSSLSPDAFRGRHLARLNSGIAGLTSSINQQVAALYRDSQRLQEQQLRTSRTDSEENGENGENDSIKEKLVDFSL